MSKVKKQKVKISNFRIAGIIFLAIYLMTVIFDYNVLLEIKKILEIPTENLNYQFIIISNWFWLVGGILNIAYDRIKNKNKIVSGFVFLFPVLVFLIVKIL